jgi:uncharacterized membrane protein required for colicin V production
MGILVIIIACAFSGYLRGLVRTVFNLCSFFISIWLTYLFYPRVGSWLRSTPLFDGMKEYFIKLLDLRPLVEGKVADAAETTGLAGLLENIPEMLRGPLERFNTPDVYEMLGVRSLEEYVGGFIANVLLQILAMILVFCLVMILMKLIGGVLDTVARLPVINLINRVGGLAAGLIIGVVLVWVGLALANMFFAGPSYPEARDMLESSVAAGWFLENNFLFDIMSRVR